MAAHSEASGPGLGAASSGPDLAGPSAGLTSMTGHGVGEAPLGTGRLVVEVRAVNHRYVDVRVRLPPEIAEHTGRVEDVVRRSLRRGRVEVLGHLTGDVGSGAALDMDKARAAFAQLSRLRDEVCPGEPVPLSLLAAVPELFASAPRTDPEETKRAVEIATTRACDAANAMRRVEGRALTLDLEQQLDGMDEHLSLVAARCPAMAEAYRDKLRQRIDHLLGDTQTALDPGRLEHEVALLADRVDVAEEITRLRSHSAQMREQLVGDGESPGKRIDFLLQEMSRETNTIGSKCADAELAQRVVEMKVAISRMREQVQNVL